jgi:hypothetical protein
VDGDARSKRHLLRFEKPSRAVALHGRGDDYELHARAGGLLLSFAAVGLGLREAGSGVEVRVRLYFRLDG